MGNYAKPALSVHNHTLGSKTVNRLKATGMTTDSLTATNATTENHTSTNLTTDSLTATSVTADTITVNGTNVGDYIENGGNGTGSVTKSLQSDTINSSQTINLNSLINSQSIESGFISVKLENNTNSTGSIGMYGIGKLHNSFIYTVLFEQDTGTSSISLNSTTGELQIVTTETVNYDIKILNLF